MAHMTQDMKAKISGLVKPVLAKYGVKGSLSVRNHMTIVLTLRSGKLDFIADMPDETIQYGERKAVDKDEMRKRYHVQVNPYWYHEHYTGQSLAFLSEAFAALKGADWYDKSDIQSDYFHTAYYYDLNVGGWDKPYTLTV